MFNGTCYLIHAEAKNFSQAQETCEGIDGGDSKLFEPTTMEENLAIFTVAMEMFDAQVEYFLGIRMESGEDPDTST